MTLDCGSDLIAPVVLGAAEDDVALHTGQLTEDVLSRARKGIVRRLACDYSPVPSAHDVAALLQSGCGLLELKLAGPKAGTEDAKQPNALEAWTLHALLLAPSMAAQPAAARPECTRLQTLVLARRGLVGNIPEALFCCVHLQCLGLNGNALTGPIPASIGELGRLLWLYLHENQLTGGVPRELAHCRHLQALHLQWNELSGPLSPALIEAWSTGVGAGGGGTATAVIKELHLAGNTELVVTDAQRAAIEARRAATGVALTQAAGHDLTNLSWPEALEPARTH